MTKVRTKKIKETLNGLIEYISNSCLVQHTNLPKLSIQDNQYFINIIQASKFDLEWLTWRINKGLSNQEEKSGKIFFPNLL